MGNEEVQGFIRSMPAGHHCRRTAGVVTAVNHRAGPARRLGSEWCTVVAIRSHFLGGTGRGRGWAGVFYKHGQTGTHTPRQCIRNPAQTLIDKKNHTRTLASIHSLTHTHTHTHTPSLEQHLRQGGVVVGGGNVQGGDLRPSVGTVSAWSSMHSANPPGLNLKGHT